MRVLVLSNIVPYPPHGGVHLRILSVLLRIARKHEVTLGCHSWGVEDREGVDWLNRNGVRTICGPLVAANWRHIAPAARDMARFRQPPEMAQYQSPEIHALIARERFDILQIEETLLAPYARSLPRDAATKTVLVFHNLHFVQERRIADLEKARVMQLWRRANGLMMRHYEPATARRFDRSITVSETDRSALLDIAPDLTIDVLPNGVDTKMMQPLPAASAKRAILFVGTLSYRPCADAAVWLVQAILPRVRRQIPDAELWIVGKSPPPEVCALVGEGVFVTGQVPDVTPYYARASVAVAPIRAGGGSRLKILEAMALGRPVVSTTIGAEGLDIRPGENILLADDAETFTAAVINLLTKEEPCRSITDNARRFVATRHDWDLIADRQLEIYDEILT